MTEQLTFAELEPTEAEKLANEKTLQKSTAPKQEKRSLKERRQQVLLKG